MSRLQEWLSCACTELGLDIHLGVAVTVNGERLFPLAVIPQLGAAKGMIVVTSYEDLLGRTAELVRDGYGYSVLSEPEPSENYDLESYIDVFSDWGWSRDDESRPAWMAR